MSGRFLRGAGSACLAAQRGLLRAYMSYHVIFVCVCACECVCVCACACACARLCVCVCACALLRVRIRACSARSIHERSHALPSICLLRIVSQHAPSLRMSRRASSGQLASPFRLPLCSYQISVTTGDVRYAGMRGHTTTTHRRPTRAHPHRLPPRLARSCIPVEPRTRPMVSLSFRCMWSSRAEPSRAGFSRLRLQGRTPTSAASSSARRARARCSTCRSRITSTSLSEGRHANGHCLCRCQVTPRFRLCWLLSYGFKFWVTSLPMSYPAGLAPTV